MVNWKLRRPTTKQQLPILRQNEDNSEYEQYLKLKTKFRIFKIMTPVNNYPRKTVDWWMSRSNLENAVYFRLLPGMNCS